MGRIQTRSPSLSAPESLTKELIMIDRKRLILIIAGAAALVLIIVALVVALILTGSKNQSESTDNGTAVTEEVEPTPEPEIPEVTFTKEQSKIVRDVAQSVVTWSGQTEHAVMVTRWIDAGMSESLAQTFTPIWAEAFDSETTAEVKAAKIGEPTVTDYVSGKEEGTGMFVVSVAITYEGYAHKNGKTTPVGYTEATWQFVLDERYNTVTQVIQPPLSEIVGLQ